MTAGQAARRVRAIPAVAEWAPSWTPTNPGAPLAFRPAPGWLPAGQRVYAIGDVHGCAAALAALLAAVRDDLAARPTGRAELVLLGDYIDFGPDSAGVLACLS
ncbi:MAG: metallophosphoesterase, partial [Mycobacterium sp.]